MDNSEDGKDEALKATALANTNIALIKYWGKRDEKLFLPMNNSISITLNNFYTITTVEFKEDLKQDLFVFNHREGSTKDQSQISSFLNLIRKQAGIRFYASVTTENHVPTGAGFASSASGYASLAAAATKAIGLKVSQEELSRIARQGSGSACRSIYGGFVEWEKGTLEDGSDSFARQLMDEKAWSLSILSVVISSSKKRTSSREGMKRTVETSPFYEGWLKTIDDDIKIAKEAIINRDFMALGEVLEHNGLKMHGTMLAARPSIIYWENGTMDVIHLVQKLRQDGMPAYFTIDAGPNVKVLCQAKDEETVKSSLLKLSSVQTVVTCYPGEGVRYLD